VPQPSKPKINPAWVITPLVVLIGLIGIATVLLVRAAQTSSKYAQQTTHELSRRAPVSRSAPTVAQLSGPATAVCVRPDHRVIWIEIAGGEHVSVELKTGRSLPAPEKPAWCSRGGAANLARVTADGAVVWLDGSGRPARLVARPLHR
jgi:hypothetical protein